MVSLGDWEWLNDVEVTFSPEEDPEGGRQLPGLRRGLKVGDSAQKSLALRAAVFSRARPLRLAGASGGSWTTTPKFDPANRTDPGDRRQSLEAAGLQPGRPARQLPAAPAISWGTGRMRLRLPRLQPPRRAVRLRRRRRGGPRRGERPGLPRPAAALEPSPCRTSTEGHGRPTAGHRASGLRGDSTARPAAGWRVGAPARSILNR